VRARVLVDGCPHQIVLPHHRRSAAAQSPILESMMPSAIKCLCLRNLKGEQNARLNGCNHGLTPHWRRGPLLQPWPFSHVDGSPWLASVHARTAATTSARQGGFVRMVASLKDDGRLSGEYPVNPTNGLPDSRSFRATGSHVSPPRLTSRTATSHVGSSLSAFRTEVASPIIS
jgi:hypothetical protein